MLRSYQSIQSTVNARVDLLKVMEQHQKFRLTDKLLPILLASNSKREQSCFQKAYYGVPEWQLEERQRPLLCHPHRFSTGSQVSLTHTSFRATVIWHQPPGVDPRSFPLCDCHSSISRFARTLSAQEQRSSRARTEDFALWTLISLWYETQTSNTKQGPPNRLRLSEKCKR